MSKPASYADAKSISDAYCLALELLDRVAQEPEYQRPEFRLSVRNVRTSIRRKYRYWLLRLDVLRAQPLPVKLDPAS